LRQQSEKPSVKRVKKSKCNFNAISQENKVPDHRDHVSLR